MEVGAIECRNCGAKFDVIWGTPFLGHYEAEDVIGLIEIAANARADNSFPDRQSVERLERLLQRYHEADDRSAFLSRCDDEFARAAWFGNRYSEYSAFRAIAKKVDFANSDVLDVGAGTGYDTWRLIQAGAHVTAFEYNPVLIRRGTSVIPEARWVGGFSHVLPFENETFDVVCCNAALHHMRDVAAAIQEMLRVLRPGGWLLTTGDPFRSDDSGEETEFEVFDRHPDVLLGVNESIPKLGDLLETFVAMADRLDVTVFTNAPPDRSFRLALRRFLRAGDTGTIREWPLSHRELLASASGSIAFRARVRRPLGLTGTRQGPTILRAGDYAAVLDDYDAAVAKLLPLLPASFVDVPFPGERQSRFELLNGWQKPRPETECRTGYRRARWFLTRPGHAKELRFDVKAERAGSPQGELRVCVTGSAGVVSLSGDEWREASVALTTIPPAARFVCELELVLPEGRDAEFDDYRFAVKDRHFA